MELGYGLIANGQKYPEITRWVRKMCEGGQAEPIIILSPHQKQHSECGVYALYYIWARLHGIPYTEFNDDYIIPDEDMIKFRKFLFRKQ